MLKIRIETTEFSKRHNHLLELAISLMINERIRQDKKWGELESRARGVPHYILTLEKKLNDARRAYYEGGHISGAVEVMQIGAVALACTQEHLVDIPPVKEPPR